MFMSGVRTTERTPAGRKKDNSYPTWTDMRRPQKASSERLSRGFDDPPAGSSGQEKDIGEDNVSAHPGQKADTPGQFPRWMGEVIQILATKDRQTGQYSAPAIAKVCQVDESTIRNRWLKALNNEIANEQHLKTDRGYTELAMELFAHLSKCRAVGLGVAEWVLQVLRPAIAATPKQAGPVDENIYESALARQKASNDEESRAAAIRWEQMLQEKKAREKAQSQLSAERLKQIRVEEQNKLMDEVQVREQIRRELMAEMGLL